MLKIDSGLYVPYRLLTETETEEIKEDLTLPNPEYTTAKRFSKYGVKKSIPEFNEFYVEDAEGIWVPRNFDLGTQFDKYYPIERDNRVVGKNADIKFTGKLRDYQETYFGGIDYNLDDLIFAMPCGTGKTSCSIYYAAKVGKKTLILVPTHTLVKQWKSRIQQFTGEEVYDFSGSVAIDKITASEIYNHNFFLTTLDTFAAILERSDLQEATYDFLKVIGLTIVDECHRVGADSLHPILFRMPSKKRLALSATFRRGDNREIILKYHFGKLYPMENVFPPAEFYALNTGVNIGKLVPRDKLKGRDEEELIDQLEKYDIPYEQTPSYINITSKRYFQNNDELMQLLKLDEKKGLFSKNLRKLLKKDTVFAQLDSFVAEHPGRTRLLHSILKMTLDSNRTSLVLSRRKKLLQTLQDVNAKRGIDTQLIVSETGDDEASPTAKIIFGIDQLAKEGYDNDRLDTLIIIHPFIDTEQAVGRVIRLLPGKKPAKVILLLDNNRSYFGIYNKSSTFIQLNAILKPQIKFGDLERIL